MQAGLHYTCVVSGVLGTHAWIPVEQGIRMFPSLNSKSMLLGRARVAQPSHLCARVVLIIVHREEGGHASKSGQKISIAFAGRCSKNPRSNRSSARNPDEACRRCDNRKPVFIRSGPMISDLDGAGTLPQEHPITITADYRKSSPARARRVFYGLRPRCHGLAKCLVLEQLAAR